MLRRVAIVLLVAGLLPCGGKAVASVDGTTSTAVVEALLEALAGPAGEYEALASYQAVLGKFGDVRPWSNTRRAEERHAEMLIGHLERYGVEVPTNPYTGKTTAPATLLDGARKCVRGEIENVAMYDRLIKEAAADPDVVRTLEHLRFASNDHHLPAFRRAVERLERAEAPAGRGQGRGPGAGHGGGPGQGRGMGRGHGARGAADSPTTAPAAVCADEATTDGC
jgi:hypothetical protein